MKLSDFSFLPITLLLAVLINWGAAEQLSPKYYFTMTVLNFVYFFLAAGSVGLVFHLKKENGGQYFFWRKWLLQLYLMASWIILIFWFQDACFRIRIRIPKIVNYLFWAKGIFLLPIILNYAFGKHPSMKFPVRTFFVLERLIVTLFLFLNSLEWEGEHITH